MVTNSNQFLSALTSNPPFYDIVSVLQKKKIIFQENDRKILLCDRQSRLAWPRNLSNIGQVSCNMLQVFKILKASSSYSCTVIHDWPDAPITQSLCESSIH